MGAKKGAPSNNQNGRPKGSLNRTTQMLNEWFDESVNDVRNKGFKHPASILLEICNDPKATRAERASAARSILPYIKSSLAALQITGANDGPVQIENIRDKIQEIIKLEE